MNLSEEQNFKNAKQLVNRNLDKFRQIEDKIVDDNFIQVIRAIELIDEEIEYVLNLQHHDGSSQFEYDIMHELLEVEKMKDEAICDCEMTISEYRSKDEVVLMKELEELIENSKIILDNILYQFEMKLRTFLNELCIIENISFINDQLQEVYKVFENCNKNLNNLKNSISASNAKDILIDNLDKLEDLLQENYQKLEDRTKARMNSSEAMSESSINTNSSSSSEDDKIESEKVVDSDCFHVDMSSTSNTRVESVEKLVTQSHELSSKIESLQEEKERFQHQIEMKQKKIIEEILKVVDLEETIEKSEILTADELHLFQFKILSLEQKLLDNFKSENSSDEIQQSLDDEIDRVKLSFATKKKSHDNEYEEFIKCSKMFASSIGNIIDEYEKFHDESTEDFAYNIDKLKKFISRPAQFCHDSNGERFYYNNEKIKVFQVDRHTSEYILNIDDGMRVKIKDGFALESDENGEYYVDVKSRKIYTKYYFENEHGRYYIDIYGDRHYQLDENASEYDLINGNWIKTKEGTYEKDEKGLRIKSEIEVEADKDGDSDDEGEIDENFVKSKSKIDSDMKYIKQTIGPAIVKAATATYLHKPNDPIQYFANHLLNHQWNQNVSESCEQELNYITELRDKIDNEKCE